jgi:uncharacterized membrane protein
VVSEKPHEVDDAPTNDRVLALSDGVFAFAMTLLVIGISVPNPDQVPASELAKYAFSQSASFYVWILSFIVIGLFWRAHHRLFRELRTYDDTLVILNLFLLLSIAFMPYPTTLIGRYSGSQFAVVLYSGDMFLISLLMSLICIRALRKPALLRSEEARKQVQISLGRGLSVDAVCILSVAVSFLSVTAAMLCWALIPFTNRLSRLLFQLGRA